MLVDSRTLDGTERSCAAPIPVFGVLLRLAIGAAAFGGFIASIA
jgi:hypothetical protein